MAKLDFGSAENLIRIGLVLSFVAITLLTGTSFAEAAKTYFWIALIILFFETFKLPSVSVTNGAIAEIILSIAMGTAAIKGLFASVGKTFTEYHIFLIMFIIGVLVIIYGAYKKL